MGDKLIIANCSGFLGDRMSAAREMVRGGEIHVLTGDYLAELTMAILFRLKSKSPDMGYTLPFLRQMEEVMGECLDKGIRVVANAGGLNPVGLARELENLGQKLGLNPKVAAITGDDLLPRLADLQAAGEPFTHLDTGQDLAQAMERDGARPITANAYLGGFGIARALDRGADIVVGGRLADAALVAGPCAWKFQWTETDYDCLAGAYAAGHIIECGTQATGGNYSFIDEIPSFENMGFPLAEMEADGSFVISKHPGTGGLVSKGTVTAQLLYEIGPAAYLTPDVTAHFDTLALSQDGPDRVRVTGATGSPSPETAKVCINTLWGHRNAMTILLTGLDIEKKAALVEDNLFKLLGGRDNFREVDVQLVRSDQSHPRTNEEAFAQLRITVMDPDPKKAGKFFSSKVVELALANIPGFNVTAPPGPGSPAIRHWPCTVAQSALTQTIQLGERILDPVAAAAGCAPDTAGETPVPPVPDADFSDEETREIPLGRLFATRSGDKGGNANLGVWGKTAGQYAFLQDFLTPERLQGLLPDLEPYAIQRFELPNLNALNFHIQGILGHGAAASTRMDTQAKTLGEYLRV
ncbi:MAG: DUF1446 domain-containing protein, partial [Desulfobacterales bacterium]|nr:DUF1446 domain-containing protein [Desulfobacterales bacterium]